MRRAATAKIPGDFLAVCCVFNLNDELFVRAVGHRSRPGDLEPTNVTVTLRLKIDGRDRGLGRAPVLRQCRRTSATFAGSHARRCRPHPCGISVCAACARPDANCACVPAVWEFTPERRPAQRDHGVTCQVRQGATTAISAPVGQLEDRAAHHANDCTHQTVECTFKPFGCAACPQRRHLGRHNADYAQQHCQMALADQRAAASRPRPGARRARRRRRRSRRSRRTGRAAAAAAAGESRAAAGCAGRAATGRAAASAARRTAARRTAAGRTCRAARRTCRAATARRAGRAQAGAGSARRPPASTRRFQRRTNGPAGS